MKKMSAPLTRDAFIKAIPLIVTKTREAIKDDLKELKSDMIDEMDSRFELFEKKMDEKFENQKNEIIKEVVDAVGALYPQADTVDKRLKHLERHTTHPPVPAP
ncbi:MAG TPA: hypothetical protein VMR81_05620 [Patescibacteria group bacterium]|nr:hypothetical protein [Patescibacteria group bacterium]